MGSDAFSVSSRSHHTHILHSAIPKSPRNRFSIGQDGSPSCHDDVVRRATTTQLNLQVLLSPGLAALALSSTTRTALTLRAAGTLLVSVGVGKLGMRGLSSSSGTIVTLLVAAFLSNLGVAPSSHALYDACWTHLLPASLALLLLAPSHSSTQSTTNTATINNANVANVANANANANQPSQKWNMIRKVMIPFVLGSLGSILGCALAWWANVQLLSSISMSSSSSSWHPWRMLAMDATEAAMAAGCLCASYIGGSVNFFAAARHFRQLNHNSPMNTHAPHGTTDLLSSMAAADLLLMAIYFAAMTGATQNRWLQRQFSNHSQESSTPTQSTSIHHERRTVYQKDDSVVATNTTTRERITKRTVAIGTASALAWAIVELSNRLETTLAPVLPGMGCASIALLGTGTSAIFQFFGSSRNRNRNKISCFGWLAHHVREVTPGMSELCLYGLFASIGTSAHWGQALQRGPACLAFAGLALLVHVMTVIFGTLGVTKWYSKNHNNNAGGDIGLEHVAVASNAAIGGPATAAAFAGTLHKQDPDQQRSLIVAATLWGVVGYAIATNIGITLTQSLLSFLPK